MSFSKRMLPYEDGPRQWAAILVTALLGGALTLWGIHGLNEYGMALFVLTPLFLGAGPTVLYAHGRSITLRLSTVLALKTLLVFTAGLLLFAIDGLICILMAAPIGLLLTWIGSLIAYAFMRKKPGQGPTGMVLLLTAIPTVAFVEHQHTDRPSMEVSSEIVVDADIHTVWSYVVEFPELEAPTELLFRAGIAYPISARIDGHGVGAIRRCNFSTGSFIEPITEWDEPRLLRFDVTENPAPMKELSFYDLDAPHLHDYFISERGQFQLTELPDGRTALKGTTWYHHDIRPVFYWRLWSDLIIHSIHERVLEHIKVNAEVAEKGQLK